MTIEAAIRELRALNEEVPKPMRLPSKADISAMERDLGFQFHPDYHQYLLCASDVVLGTLEPAEITVPGSPTYLPRVIAGARAVGIPSTLLPFCEDNGDYYCMRCDGVVEFWSHNGRTIEVWQNLAAWVHEVWIGGHA